MAAPDIPSIQGKLTNMNTMYFGTIDNAFLGNAKYVSDITFSGTGSSYNQTLYTSTNRGPLYMARIFGNDTTPYSSASGSVYTAIPTTNSIPLPAAQSVVVFNVNSSSGAIVAPTTVAPASFGQSSYNISNSNLPITTDINCMDLLLTRSGQSLSQIPEGFFVLQGLYAWYSLFDATNWKRYSSGFEINISVPDLALPPNNATGAISYNTLILPAQSTLSTVAPPLLNSQKAITNTANNPLLTNMYTLMNNLIPFTVISSPNFNPFVARRLVHLYIILFQFNNAITYKGANSAQSNDPLLDAIYKLLQQLNKNVTDVNNGSFTNIVQAVNHRLTAYNQNISQITTLNDNMSTLKDTISTDSSNLSGRIQYQAKFKVYQKIALVMLLIITIGAIILFTFPMDYKKKLSGGGLLILISVITAFILQYQYNRTLSREGFVDAPFMTGSGGTTTGNAASTFFTQLMNDTSKYLDNTLLLTTTLDSYHLYGNVNQSLLRENSFFNDSVNSLRQKDYNMKSIYNITYLDQIRFSALMNLAISLSLIVAVTVTIALSLEGYTELRKYVLGFGILLALISIVIYILEITSRVHTHPKQIYWGVNDKLVKSIQ